MPHQHRASKEEVDLSYEYALSVIGTADDIENNLWHAWALREAFLAGMHAAKTS
jgi:hypothetical protein